MSEEWRPIPGYEGEYEVSDHGRVRSLDRMIDVAGSHRHGPIKRRRRGAIMTPRPLGRRGYLRVSLPPGRDYYIHRLVLEVFVGPPPFAGAQGAHWDGDEANNRLENLRWATSLENHADMARHGTRWDRRGERAPGVKLKKEQVLAIRAQPARVRSAVLAEEYGVHQSTIHAIRRGISWTNL